MERIFFDYSKLAGRIKEKYGSQKAFAKAMGMAEASLSNKMTGIYYFSQAEIEKAGRLLELEPGTYSDYFFTVRVRKSEQEGGRTECDRLMRLSAR